MMSQICGKNHVPDYVESSLIVLQPELQREKHKRKSMQLTRRIDTHFAVQILEDIACLGVEYANSLREVMPLKYGPFGAVECREHRVWGHLLR